MKMNKRIILTNTKRKTNKLPKRLPQVLSRIPLTPSLLLTKRSEKITIDFPMFARTGQSNYSFSSSSQVFFIQLTQQLISTAFWGNTVTDVSGLPQYEYGMVHRMNFEFLPNELIMSQKTFELTPFNLRYLDSTSTDSGLPASYNVLAQPVNLKCLINQTNRPQQFTVDLPNTMRVGVGEAPVLGQLMAIPTFSPATCGIIVLNQPTGYVNSVATYNPQIGVIRVTYQVYLVNALF